MEIFHFLISLFGVINISYALNGYSDAEDWGSKALAIQSAIDNNLPLYETIWIGTHNSYSNRDDDWFIDLALNQPHSITAQLEDGIRYLGLDVYKHSSEIRCCHGSCGSLTGDRKLGKVFNDIKDFLFTSPDQVLFIKLWLDDSMDSKLHQLEHLIVTKFGTDYIYRPNIDHGCSLPSNECCGLDINMKKSDILFAGKNIIFYTKDCINDELQAFVFQDTGTDSVTSFSQTIPTSIDPTQFTSLYDGSVKGNKNIVIHKNNIDDLFDLGLNMFEVYGFNGGSAWDSSSKNVIQNHYAVWSWVQWYPSDAGGDCVSFNVGGSKKFQNTAVCIDTKKAVCYDGTNWKVTTTTTSWSNAETQCDQDYGASYTFSVPKTPLQRNDLLTLNEQDIWVNYKKDNSKWVVDI